jgi:hypothetical protein
MFSTLTKDEVREVMKYLMKQRDKLGGWPGLINGIPSAGDD